MTKSKVRTEPIDVKELLKGDEDFLRAALRALLQAALEAEMTETIGVEEGERAETRLAYRSGYNSRSLTTLVGTLELRVPLDRMGAFRPSCSSASSARRRRWSAPCRRCMCRASHPQGQGGDRSLVWAQLLGLGDQLLDQP
jgi:transposase-like protein